MFSGCFLIFIKPRNSSFKFYNKKNRIGLDSSKLRLDGFYTTNQFWPWVRDDRKSCWFVFFDEKGIVTPKNGDCNMSKESVKSYYKHAPFGYYKIDKDTVYYTTQVHYNKKSKRRQTVARGIVYKDSICFKGKLRNQTYYFRPW